MLIRSRLLILNSLLLLTLLGSHFGRRVESASLVRADFLHDLALPFRGWKTSEIPIPPSELDLLEPDATLMRRYDAPDKQWVELAIIAGHRKKSVHTPAFCMAGGGWDILTQQGCTLSLSGHAVPATRMLMRKDGGQLLVTYFFTDGEYCTSNLIQFQGVQVLKRFQARVPLGALVRILVPVSTDQAAAVKVTDEFAEATLPASMALLKQTRLNVR